MSDLDLCVEGVLVKVRAFDKKVVELGYEGARATWPGGKGAVDHISGVWGIWMTGIQEHERAVELEKALVEIKVLLEKGVEG